MKKSLITIVLLVGVIANTFGQISTMKKFDYRYLEGRTLIIPQLKFEKKHQQFKKILKTEHFQKLVTESEKIEEYTKIWKTGVEQSSFKMLPYEIRDFEIRQVAKSRDTNVVAMIFYEDMYYNEKVMLVSYGPRSRKILSETYINDFDLTKVEDIRLMMNMIDFSLNQGIQNRDKEDYLNYRKSYKKNFVDFTENMENMTFWVAKFEHKNPKRAQKKNLEIEEALKSWSLSKYEIVSNEEINIKRLEKEKNSFYWRSFPVYTQSPLVVLQINAILSTENDEVYFYKELGSRKLKGSTIEEIQKNIKNRAERYKKQFEKN